MRGPAGQRVNRDFNHSPGGSTNDDAAVPDRRRPRRRILDAALEWPRRAGYDAVQVERSPDPGVSSRTIYSKFSVARFAAHRCRGRTVAGSLHAFPATHRRRAARRPRGVNQLINELTETMTANAS